MSRYMLESDTGGGGVVSLAGGGCLLGWPQPPHRGGEPPDRGGRVPAGLLPAGIALPAPRGPPVLRGRGPGAAAGSGTGGGGLRGLERAASAEAAGCAGQRGRS